MKKLIALLLAAIMLLSLAACGGSSDSSTAAETAEAAEDTAAAEEVSESAAEPEAAEAEASAEDIAEFMRVISGPWAAEEDGGNYAAQPEYDITLYEDGTLEFCAEAGTWEISELKYKAEAGEDGSIDFDFDTANGTVTLSGTAYAFELYYYPDSMNCELFIEDSNTGDSFTCESGMKLEWSAHKADLGSANAEADSGADFAALTSELSGRWISDYQYEGVLQSDYDIVLHEDGSFEFQSAGGSWEITETEVLDEETVEEVHISAIVYGSLTMGGTTYDFEIHMLDDTASYYSMYIYEQNEDSTVFSVPDAGSPGSWSRDK